MHFARRVAVANRSGSRIDQSKPMPHLELPPFADGILHSFLLHVSLVKSTSAPLQF
jgi:hypothetical protein